MGEVTLYAANAGWRRGVMPSPRDVNQMLAAKKYSQPNLFYLELLAG